MNLPSIRIRGFYSKDFNWESNISIHWYKHHKTHPWKGFSFHVAVIGYVGQMIVIWSGKEQYDSKHKTDTKEK